MREEGGRPRVRLLPVGADGAAALRSGGLPGGATPARGWPTPDTFALLQCLAAGGLAWLVVDDTGRVIGECATKGAPSGGGVVEIGYALVPSARGRGLGRGTVAALVARLDRRADVVAVEADVAEDNVASRRVLEHSGFTVVETDHTVVRYRRETPVSPWPARW